MADDAELVAGGLVLLPTMRFGVLHRVSHTGRRVFVTPGGELLCEHGERPSTILNWTRREERCALEGKPIPQRQSPCDCRNTDCLYHPKSSQALSTNKLPALPSSLFQFLEDMDTRKSVVRGRTARLVPINRGVSDLYVTESGNFVCAHHHSRKTLKTRQLKDDSNQRSGNFRGGVCGCVLERPLQRKNSHLTAKPRIGKHARPTNKPPLAACAVAAA